MLGEIINEYGECIGQGFRFMIQVVLLLDFIAII